MPKLIRPTTLFHLREAEEELQRLISKLSIEKDDILESDIEFKDAMIHIFHHLNFAWNVRNIPLKDYDRFQTAKFDEWRQFPTDIKLPGML